MKKAVLLLMVLLCLAASQFTTAQVKQLKENQVIYYNDLEESGVIAVLNKDESPLKQGSYELMIAPDEQLFFTIDDNGNIAGELTYWYNRGNSDEIKVAADFEDGFTHQITVYNKAEYQITYLQFKDRKPYNVKYTTQEGKTLVEIEEDPETGAGFIKEYRNGRLKEEEYMYENGSTVRNWYAPNGKPTRTVAYQNSLTSEEAWNTKETIYNPETGKIKEKIEKMNSQIMVERYNDKGTLIYKSVSDPNHPEYSHFSREYNTKGKLIKESLEKAEVILETFYDENGAVTKTNTVTKLTGKKQDETPIEYVLGGDKYVNDGKVMQSVIKEPADYPGGITAFQKYVQINFRFPAQAKEKGISGLAKVQFIVDENGEITDFEPVEEIIL